MGMLTLKGCCYGVLVTVALLAATARPGSVDVSVDVYTLCNVRKYETGSAFDQDLQAAWTSLKAKASVSAYALETAGSDIRAAYQCRGDLSLDLCSQCVSQAAQTAGASCPNAIGSRVQLNGCFLRYENYSFAIPDSSIVIELCNVNKDNGTSFQSDVASLLRAVTDAAPGDKGLFAAASARWSDDPSARLYALAQCLGYLSRAECSDCLAAHRSSWQDCDRAVGAQIHSVDCYYRFEIYPFYNT